MSRKKRLDRATVVQAAAEILKEEGPEALSLSGLAGRLGVKPPSLYNHIEGLEDLQYALAALNARMLADRLAEAAIGSSGPELLTRVAQTYRAYIKEFPGLYLSTLQLSNPQGAAGEAIRRDSERSVQIAAAAVSSFGLQGQDAIHAVRALRSAIHGFATLEIAGGFGLPLDCDESFRRLIDLLIQGLQRPAPRTSSRNRSAVS